MKTGENRGLQLALHGKRRGARLSEALKWTRRLVFGFFALVGAIALGRTWTHPLLGSTQPLQGAGSSSAASADSAAVSAANPPVDVRAPVTIASSDDPDATSLSSAVPVLDYAEHKAAAEEELKARMPEIDGLQYRDVKTNLSIANGQQMVDFCGEVNSLNPMGVYVGFQKFIASRSDARIEQGAPPGEFSEAWRQRCTGTEGPQIWN